MSNIAHIPVEKSLARAILGMVVVALLAPPLSAQFVGTEISSGLFEPSAVTTDADGNVFITDSSDNCIDKFVPSSGVLSTLAGTAGTDTAGTNNGFGNVAQFSQPRGIVAARGGLVVVDQVNQLIRYVSFAGAVSNLAGMAGAIGNQDGPALSATFAYPNGIAADGAGNLYIADEGNNAIRLIDTNNTVSTIPVGGYQFSAPSAVALDGYNNLWVADTGHDVICLVSNNTVTVMAGISGSPGTNDSLFATSARFNLPGGMVWSGAINGFLISDTGNDTVRGLILTNVNGAPTYSVQTIAGIPKSPGLVDGPPRSAKFSTPTGLAIDANDFGYFIVDTGNNVVRVFQPTAPQAPVPAPIIGYVTYEPIGAGLGSVFHPSTGAVFDNQAVLAIEYEFGTQTYMTYGATPTNALVNPIASPGPAAGSSPQDYPGDGTPPPIHSILSPIPDLTIYAIGEESGRQSSGVVSARFRFITASPVIGGNNAAAITLTDDTTNAAIWYTVDGSVPVPGATNTFGPAQSGDILSLDILTNTIVSARAFLPGFSPSGVATSTFSPLDLNGDKLTFGFEAGEASSEFIAAAGQRFLAPLTLSLIPSGLTVMSLQFDLAVTNLSGPPVAPTYEFQSMLTKPDPTRAGFYIPIPPDLSLTTNGPLQSLVFANDSSGLLEIGWVERPPFTNLYPTTAQTLINTSQAHDTVFESGNGKVICGAFSFVVPPNATIGETYQITAANPSATSDGVRAPVFIQIVSDGSKVGGTINSVKVVTVGTAQYLVGDAAPFRWFNAGDFGDSTLQANDVSQIFQSALYNLNYPPFGSDFFDVMDSSDGSDNNLYDGNDTTINNIKFGDGILAVDDVYVTYRRSLDPSLVWYDRFWSNGVRQAVEVPNTLQPVSLKRSSAPGKTALSGPRYITVAADQVQSGGSLNVQIPVRVLAADTMPIRVMMINAEIDPLDGSPPVTGQVSFSPVAALGTSATLSASIAANMYGAAFLNSTVQGVSGTSLIGTLNVTLPANVTANSAYLVHFDHFSASPNGLALFHATVQDGLITVGNRTGSSWNDGIPDTWRLLYFGSVSNALSAAAIDADGDGASNWQEFIAGTNPLDAASVLQFRPATTTSGGFVLQWPSVVNKHYSLQSCSAIDSGNWTTIATNLTGTGQAMQWTDTGAASTKFYRAQVQ